MPKKKFISKKNSVSFQLVHRSQQDPLIADEDAPQRVLVPIISQKESKDQKDKRIEEQHKYGIYYNDDTNYLEHLKDRDDTKMEWPEHAEAMLKELEKKAINIKLPSCVLPSDVEEPVGMLGKAAPDSSLRLDLDPDLIAAMDDDFNYDDPENKLENNFIELAGGVASDEELDGEDFKDKYFFDEAEEDAYISSDGMDVNSTDSGPVLDKQRPFKKEVTKSQMSSYSATTGSVDNRSDQQKLLDEAFDVMYAKTYEQEESDLDDDDAPRKELGEIEKQRIREYAEEFEESRRPQKLDMDSDSNEKVKMMYLNNMLNQRTEYRLYTPAEKLAYDCKTAPSLCSSYVNQPGVIKAPPSVRKLKLLKQQQQMRMKKNTNEEEEMSDALSDTGSVTSLQSCASRMSELSIRPINETPEERRARKKEFKELKREKRAIKKVLMEKSQRKIAEQINALKKQPPMLKLL